MKKEIKVWHLELTEQIDTTQKDIARIDKARIDTARINKAQKQASPYKLIKISNQFPEFNRFLYLSVGAPWGWYVRLAWTYTQWFNYLNKESVQTWVAYDGGLPIGYFELEVQGEQTVEVCYFGLLPFAIGKGYGKLLLEETISKAWEIGGKRVWLHTCSLDHDSALPNYLARGFKVFKEETLVEDIPDEAIQPWLDANKPPKN